MIEGERRSHGPALALFAGCVALLLTLFAPVALLRFLGAVIALLIAASFLYSRIVPRFLSVERESPIVRGVRLKRAELRLTVASRLPISLPAVRLVDSVGRLPAEQSVFRLAIPARGSVTTCVVIRPQERGEFSVGPVHLAGFDPFGLFRWERSFPAPCTVVVFPALFRVRLVDERGLPAGTIRSSSPVHEDLTRYRGLREYVVGDEPKRINWKATAKTGRLFTTEYDRTLFFPVRVLLNLCREDYPERRRDHLIERAIETAASVAVSYVRLGQAVGLAIAPGEEMGGAAPAAGEEPIEVPLPERAGWAHAEKVLERLARLGRIGGHADFGPLLVRGSGSVRLILVGPDLTDEQTEVAVAARRRGVSLEHLKILSATEAERNRELAALLRVTAVEEGGGDIVAG